MKKNICLIGYMGSGKSTVGRIVADRLGMDFKDTDELIEKEEGRSIPDIFRDSGEPYFRELEYRLMTKIAGKGDMTGTVLSTGGGLPVDVRNRELLKRAGTVIYLKASCESLGKRIGDDMGRPLLESGDRLKKIRDMLGYREPIYAGCADHILVTDKLSVEETVQAVLEYSGIE